MAIVVEAGGAVPAKSGVVTNFLSPIIAAAVRTVPNITHAIVTSPALPALVQTHPNPALITAALGTIAQTVPALSQAIAKIVQTPVAPAPVIPSADPYSPMDPMTGAPVGPRPLDRAIPAPAPYQPITTPTPDALSMGVPPQPDPALVNYAANAPKGPSGLMPNGQPLAPAPIIPPQTAFPGKVADDVYVPQQPTPTPTTTTGSPGSTPAVGPGTAAPYPVGSQVGSPPQQQPPTSPFIPPPVMPIGPTLDQQQQWNPAMGAQPVTPWMGRPSPDGMYLNPWGQWSGPTNVHGLGQDVVAGPGVLNHVPYSPALTGLSQYGGLMTPNGTPVTMSNWQRANLNPSSISGPGGYEDYAMQVAGWNPTDLANQGRNMTGSFGTDLSAPKNYAPIAINPAPAGG